jgi:phospholipid transport system substrate-binding protein
MNYLRRRSSWAVLAASILTGIASPLPAGEPLDLVRSAAERAIQVLKDPKLKAPEKKTERIERLKEIINPFSTTKRWLGARWVPTGRAERRLSRKNFTDNFVPSWRRSTPPK